MLVAPTADVVPVWHDATVSHALKAAGYSERELQVLESFGSQRRGAQYLAVSRCPNDKRVIGAVRRFPDGLWAWHAGSRLSPRASRVEVRSWYLDLLDEDKISAETCQEANDFADAQLAGAERYETPPTVVKILSGGPEEEMKIGPWRGAAHALQFFANGLPLLQPTTCACRQECHVQMLALVYAGVCVAAGTVRTGIHVPALPIRRGGPSAAKNGLAYSFEDGRLRVNLDAMPFR